jgi:hypothetical protein
VLIASGFIFPLLEFDRSDFHLDFCTRRLSGKDSRQRVASPLAHRCIRRGTESRDRRTLWDGGRPLPGSPLLLPVWKGRRNQNLFFLPFGFISQFICHSFWFFNLF